MAPRTTEPTAATISRSANNLISRAQAGQAGQAVQGVSENDVSSYIIHYILGFFLFASIAVNDRGIGAK